MAINDLMQLFPSKRIKPVDGLAVTADVWEEAHEFHRQSERFHTMMYHGCGIVAGLQVIASDPPDCSVFILPGIAVDPLGRTIVLPQPVAYDIGDEMAGLLHITLSYEESAPRAAESGREGAPKYIHCEFSIAAHEALPETPYVELARVDREKRTDFFQDAENPLQPGPNELDLRNRRQVQATSEASVAVCYVGDVDEKLHGMGVTNLAGTLNRQGRCYVEVKDDVQLAPGVENNSLIYLVGQGKFKLSPGQLNGLSNYVKRAHGTLLMEAIDSKAKISFLDSLEAMEIEVESLPAGHRLLVEPHLFAAPPVGYELDNTPEVMIGDGVIVSMCNYGRLWQGQAKGGVPTREQLRSAIEWGQNILTYATGRYRRG